MVQGLDFEELQDYALKLEQENKRLREALEGATHCVPTISQEYIDWRALLDNPTPEVK